MNLKRPALFTPKISQFQFSLLGFILVIAVIPAVAQVPTGSVQGRVICSDGNFPARDANVDLIPLTKLLPQKNGKKSSQEVVESRTDFNGNYAIASVPPGTYIVYAKYAGYSSDFPLVRSVLDRFSLDDQKKLLSNFPQVTIEAGSIATGNVVIYRGGAISGRVTVDTGGTAGRVVVNAVMVSSDLVGDEDKPGEEPLHLDMTGMTDDRGNYRIAGLPAGKYLIEVTLIESYYAWDGRGSVQVTSPGSASLTIFAPNAFAKSKTKPIKLGDGDELSDIDITIPMSLLHSVGGTVTRGGAPVAGASLSITRQGQTSEDSDDDSRTAECKALNMLCRTEANSATSLPDGSFRFDLLPPGTYTIKAQLHFAVSTADHYPSAKITVQVNDSDIQDANIDLPTTAGQEK